LATQTAKFSTLQRAIAVLAIGTQQTATIGMNNYSLSDSLQCPTNWQTSNKGEQMTKTEFAALCLKFQINPYVALENENLVEALRERDDRKAIEILVNEF